MKKYPILALTLFSVATTQASPILFLLNFEGLQDSETVEEYYNGGTGGAGSGPGFNYGVSFSPGALALIDADAGGSGDFGGEPSPSTVLFFRAGGAAILDRAGFNTLSFYYSAVNTSGFIKVYNGPNATGTLLATLNLPITGSDGGDPTGTFSPFVPISVAFTGTASSIDFGGAAGQIAFDDIMIGIGDPVPDAGSTLVLMGLAAAGLGVLRRQS